MDSLRNRTAALTTAAALAVGLAACGGTDEVDRLQKDAEDTGRDLRKQGEDVRKSVERGDSPREIEKKTRKLERDAQKKGRDLQRQGEDVQKNVPGY